VRCAAARGCCRVWLCDCSQRPARTVCYDAPLQVPRAAPARCFFLVGDALCHAGGGRQPPGCSGARARLARFWRTPPCERYGFTSNAGTLASCGPRLAFSPLVFSHLAVSPLPSASSILATSPLLLYVAVRPCGPAVPRLAARLTLGRPAPGTRHLRSRRSFSCENACHYSSHRYPICSGLQDLATYPSR
jgi:hypothetical protein